MQSNRLQVNANTTELGLIGCATLRSVNSISGYFDSIDYEIRFTTLSTLTPIICWWEPAMQRRRRATELECIKFNCRYGQFTPLSSMFEYNIATIYYIEISYMILDRIRSSSPTGDNVNAMNRPILNANYRLLTCKSRHFDWCVSCDAI